MSIVLDLERLAADTLARHRKNYRELLHKARAAEGNRLVEGDTLVLHDAMQALGRTPADVAKDLEALASHADLSRQLEAFGDFRAKCREATQRREAHERETSRLMQEALHHASPDQLKQDPGRVSESQRREIITIPIYRSRSDALVKLKDAETEVNRAADKATRLEFERSMIQGRHSHLFA